VQRPDDGGGQRPRDVADAEADDLGLRVRLGERLDTLADVGEEIAGLQLEVVVIDSGQGDGPPFPGGPF
jgi:hypothetical protein